MVAAVVVSNNKKKIINNMAYLIVYYTVTYCNKIVYVSKITKDFIDNFVETNNGCKIVNIIKLED